jgi:hypothetical protein
VKKGSDYEIHIPPDLVMNCIILTGDRNWNSYFIDLFTGVLSILNNIAFSDRLISGQ